MAVFCKLKNSVVVVSLLLAAFVSSSGRADAQTSYASSDEVTMFKKALLDLILQCPAQSTDYQTDIENCKSLEPKMIELRTNHRVKNWVWADDRLNQYRTLLHSRIAILQFGNSGRRDELTCHHAEKAWLSLSNISVEDRAENVFFDQTKPGLQGFVELCRKEMGAAEWGAPLASNVQYP